MIAKIDQNKMKLYGRLWDGDGQFIIEDFQMIDGQYDVIEIHLHTPGGSVFDGNLIYNAFRNAKSKLHMYIDGVVASMGTIIMLPADKIYMADNGFLMIHAPSGFTAGNAKDHLNGAKLLRSMEQNFIGSYVKRTGKDKEDIEKWLDGDNWFNSREAKKAKLIDEIVDTVIDNDDMPEGMNTKNFAAAANVSDADFESPLAKAKKQKTKSDLEMKKEFIADLGLKSVTAESSDSAVIEAVKAHYDAKINDLQNKLNKLEKEQQEKAQAQIKATLEAAIKEGKIQEDERKTYQEIGEKAGFEHLNAVLSKKEAHQPISSMISGGLTSGISNERKDWDFETWQEKDPRGLEALETENPEAFNKLYDAWKKKYGIA